MSAQQKRECIINRSKIYIEERELNNKQIVTFGKIPYYLQSDSDKTKVNMDDYINTYGRLPKYLDCSDFVQAVYQSESENLGMKENQLYLTNYTGTMRERGKDVLFEAIKGTNGSVTYQKKELSKMDLKPGDIIFFDWDRDANDLSMPPKYTKPEEEPTDHVGIYIGFENGKHKFIHESGSTKSYGKYGDKDPKTGKLLYEGSIKYNYLEDNSSYYWNCVISVRRIIQEGGNIIN
ncbi:MAG: C40 family peptidase [Clostridiaceae bacterium]|nr:C40 family peptidase [Clostridiaceae bacterium]